MGVVVTVKIKDEEVWQEFKNYVLFKHGKLHTALGYELTEAISEYLKSVGDKDARTHKFTHVEAGNKTMKNLKEITNRIMEEAEKEIPQTRVERIITESAGGDSRTLRKYLVLLHGYNILKPVRTIAGAEKPKFIFEVNLDEAKKLTGLPLQKL